MLDLSNAILTDHAKRQMTRRQIAEPEVFEVLGATRWMREVGSGRVVVQGETGGYLLRVFVDVDRSPPEAGTVNRASKINKYRSEP